MAVSAGRYSTCAVLTTGAVRCWGAGGQGQLGYANIEDVGDDETPAFMGDIALGALATEVTVGFSHACARTEDEEVRCWGLGAWGQLGYGNQDTIGDDEHPFTTGDVPIHY